MIAAHKSRSFGHCAESSVATRKRSRANSCQHAAGVGYSRNFLSIAPPGLCNSRIEALLLERGWLGYACQRWEEATVALNCARFNLVLVHPSLDSAGLETFIDALGRQAGSRPPLIQVGPAPGQLGLISRVSSGHPVCCSALYQLVADDVALAKLLEEMAAA